MRDRLIELIHDTEFSLDSVRLADYLLENGVVLITLYEQREFTRDELKNSLKKVFGELTTSYGERFLILKYDAVSLYDKITLLIKQYETEIERLKAQIAVLQGWVKK